MHQVAFPFFGAALCNPSALPRIICKITLTPLDWNRLRWFLQEVCCSSSVISPCIAEALCPEAERRQGQLSPRSFMEGPVEALFTDGETGALRG